VLTLAPGQSGTFRVSAATPGQPGDLAAAVVLHPSLGQQVAVPLVLRSLIAIQNGRGTFTGTLRGGDGFGPVDVPGPAQISTYRFEIPAGLHDFGLSLTLSGNPDEQVFGYLEDPHGQLLSQQVNVTGFARTATRSSAPRCRSTGRIPRRAGGRSWSSSSTPSPAPPPDSRS
jgi:hypothetical protein